MTDQPSTQELRELAAEVNRKQNAILAERKRRGLKPGEPLLGLHLDEGTSTTQEAEKALEPELHRDADGFVTMNWPEGLRSTPIARELMEDFVEQVNELRSLRTQQGEPRMWVYKKTGTKMWTVGYYKPDGDWRPESDHNRKLCAAKRVSFLNGGRRSWTRCKCKGFASS